MIILVKHTMNVCTAFVIWLTSFLVIKTTLPVLFAKQNAT